MWGLFFTFKELNAFYRGQGPMLPNVGMECVVRLSNIYMVLDEILALHNRAWDERLLA